MVYDGVTNWPQRQDTLDCAWIGNTVTGTTTVITSIPTNASSGSTFTISGTIKTVAGTNIPTSHGTMKIQKLVGSTWTDLYTSLAITTGAWSKTGATQTTTTSYRAVYVPPVNTVTNRVVTGGSATLTIGTHTFTTGEYITTTGFLGTDATANLNGTFLITSVVANVSVTFALAGTVTTGAPVSGATPQVTCGHAVSVSATKSVSVQVLTTFVKTYSTNGTGSYRGSGTKRTDVGTDFYQGYYSSTNGTQRSVILFPYATIQSDLSGYTSITKVEVYLNCNHWGPDSGGTAVVVDHNYSSLPASDPGFTTTYASSTAWTTKTGAKWCNVNTSIGARLAAGTAKGLGLYTTSTATEYYGSFNGNGDTGEPVLRITYTKYV